ncbi:MAG: hypothetical protein C0594_17660, partial [Marinilabiliales bacterium]
MRIAFTLTFVLLYFSLYAQTTHKSIHQEQLEYYNSLGIDGNEYYQINQPENIQESRATSTCNLNKVVFGWHPYWSNGLEANYNWNLLSDLSFFSFEVDPSTGYPSTTHGWKTSAIVDEALNNGVRVNLCVTLFSNHSTLFASATAQQNLIDTLISLVQYRNANGVNIDFEGVSSSLKTQFTNFMIDLCTQMHTEIPGSQVSMCLYAVDWSDVFDEAALDPYIDYYTIMGYAYYYSGSGTAGPTAPLYTFSSYNYNLSKTVNYYLTQGASKEKLVLGLPYYGFEWNTTSGTIPSSTTSSVSSRTYKYVKDNSTGNYSTRLWDANSMSPYYVYNSGNWRQCFCDDEESLGRRYDLVNMQNIAGIAIWALGYDDGYTELWNLIEDKFTNCASVPCSDTIYDMGGPNRVYFDDDDYTFTIAPSGASGLSLDFINFDIEAGSGSDCDYDYLEIFDGPDISSPSLGKFCNTNGSPGNIVASGSELTLHFHSDGATYNDGYMAVWNCTYDNTPPETQINADNWASTDFTADFIDTDNDTITERYYQVLDFNGTEWRANSSHGFLNDNFETSIHPEWTNASGDWIINASHLNQTNEDSSNTNLYIPINQQTGEVYMYNWKMNIGGSGANRRAGFHFFCDSPELIQRGNSYMVYFRVDNNKCQLYKAENDSIDLYTNDDVNVEADTWYDYKIIFNTISGEIKAYQNDVLVSAWTDPAPYTSGTHFSLRTGNCNVLYDDIKIYRARTESELISVGSSSDMVRYENPDPFTPACRIKTIVMDDAGNFSLPGSANVNIDWTAPADIQIVNDGLSVDIDTTTSLVSLSANWSSAFDPNSLITNYWYSIGTMPGSTDILDWTDNNADTIVTVSGLSLQYETEYFFTVKAINQAGLWTGTTISDGQLIVDTILYPTADFTYTSTHICEGNSITFTSLCQNADSILWSFPGGNPSESTNQVVDVLFPDGAYSINLIAYGNNQSVSYSEQISVTTQENPVADFSVSNNELYLPNAIVYFANNSTGADNYYWTLGDGTTSE